MTIGILGLTLEALGAVMIAYTVIRTHAMVERERRIDTRIVRAIRGERTMAIVGVLFVIAGYLIQVWERL